MFQQLDVDFNSNEKCLNGLSVDFNSLALSLPISCLSCLVNCYLKAAFWFCLLWLLFNKLDCLSAEWKYTGPDSCRSSCNHHIIYNKYATFCQQQKKYFPMKNSSICKNLFIIWTFLGWVQLNGLEDINPIYDPVIAGHGAQVVKLYDPRNNSLINCTLIDKVSQKKPNLLIKLFNKYSVTPIQWGTRYNFLGVLPTIWVDGGQEA